MKIYNGNDWKAEELLDGRCAPPMRRAEPPLSAFSRRELRLIDRLRTPLQVQRYLNALPYNTEPPPGRATLRSFRGVVSTTRRIASKRRWPQR